jgi:hypothetical protein
MDILIFHDLKQEAYGGGAVDMPSWIAPVDR